MSKIIAIVPIYNCADTILIALQSIDGLVDEIYCYNGRWAVRDGPDYSPDNTEDLIKEWCKTSKSKVVIYHLMPNLHEWEFHNEILKTIDNGNWLFKIDADEVILEWINVRETIENSIEKAYRVCLVLFKPYAAVPNAKFYRKTPTLHYDLNHREIFDNGGWIDTAHAHIIHIVYDHQPKAFMKKDREVMKKCESRLFEYEQKELKNQKQ